MNKEPFFPSDRLTSAQVEQFRLFDDEKLIFACREHWLSLVVRISFITVFGFIFGALSSFLMYMLFGQMYIAVLSLIFTLLIVSTIIIRQLMHWSFHIYIATNRQILELYYTPLQSQVVNSVLLDQIRCTEVDSVMVGFVSELLGVGNVEVTFDRPTHKETFVIRGVRSPQEIAHLLSATIHQSNTGNVGTLVNRPVWTRELVRNRYKFLGDLTYGDTA